MPLLPSLNLQGSHLILPFLSRVEFSFLCSKMFQLLQAMHRENFGENGSNTMKEGSRAGEQEVGAHWLVFLMAPCLLPPVGSYSLAIGCSSTNLLFTFPVELSLGKSKEDHATHLIKNHSCVFHSYRIKFQILLLNHVRGLTPLSGMPLPTLCLQT